MPLEYVRIMARSPSVAPAPKDRVPLIETDGELFHALMSNTELEPAPKEMLVNASTPETGSPLMETAVEAEF